MAFGIVVIASQIGTGDVGGQVLGGLQKLDAKLAFSAGFCIVFAAIALDRITTGERSTASGGRADAGVDRRPAQAVDRVGAGRRGRRGARGQGARRAGLPVVAHRHRLVGQVGDRLAQRARPPRRADHRWHRFDQRLPRPRRPRSRSAACCSRRRGGWSSPFFAVLGWISKGWRLALLCAAGARRHRRDAQLGSGHGHAQPGAGRRHHQRLPGHPDRHLVRPVALARDARCARSSTPPRCCRSSSTSSRSSSCSTSAARRA